MALDVSPDGLAHELKQAKFGVSKFASEGYREAIRRYCGPAYRQGSKVTVDFYNHAYAWISIYLPIFTSGNPRIKAKTMKMGAAAAFSKAVELATNRNFELTDVKRTIEQLAVDWAFKYCVALTMPMPVKGLREREDPPHRPMTKRLSLEDYIWDTLSKQHAECRFQGHRIVRDQDSLLQEARDFPERRWDKSAILAMNSDKAMRAQREKSGSEVHRGEVEFWEFWVPEMQLDRAYDEAGKAFQPTEEEGFHGTIFTVTEDGGSFPREPRPFFGPRDGAYTFSSYLYVPDEVVGVAPLVATAVQEEEYQKTLSGAVAAIRAYKQGLAVNGNRQELAQKMADFVDLGVFVVDGAPGEKIQEAVQQVTAGGLTQQHLVHLETERTLLDQMSGLTDAKLGLTTGATATEASIAQMSSGQRQGGMTEKFLGTCVKPIAKKEAWYLTNDPRSRTPLGEGAEGMFVDQMTGQPIIQPVFMGGPGHADLLEEMEVEIQPISMRFTTEMLEAERAASWEAWVLSTAPMIPQTPYIEWELLYQKKAEQMGDPSLAKTVNIQKAMMMGMMMMQMNMGAGAPGAQPRMGVDLQGAPPSTPKPNLKSSEKSTGFSANARPQPQKGPRMAGASSNTH